MLSYHRTSVSDPPRTSKTAGFSTYPGSDLNIIAKIMNAYTWSPIVWKHGYRKGDNFICSHFLGLDFESHEYSLEQALSDFCDMQHVIGTTQNHQVAKPNETPKDRFRVLVPWDSPITDPAVYSYNLEFTMKWYDCDASGKDLARQFYRCWNIVSVCTEGETYEVRPLPIVAPTDRFAKARAYGKLGFLGFFTKRCMTQVIPEGERNTACFRMGCEFARCGVDYEDAVMRVLESPTYQLGVEPRLLREIEKAMWSGYLTEGVVTGAYNPRRS